MNVVGPHNHIQTDVPLERARFVSVNHRVFYTKRLLSFTTIHSIYCRSIQYSTLSMSLHNMVVAERVLVAALDLYG
jgi:hypothetical protein